MGKDIFISYSRRDRERVHEVVSALERDGFSVWIDRQGIDGGDDFVERIVSALRGCEVVVFFSSAASNESPWTKREIHLARENNRTIIPVRLDMTPYIPTAAFFLSGVQYIDMTDPENTERAIAALERALRVYVERVFVNPKGERAPGSVEDPTPWREYRRKKFGLFYRRFGYVDAFGKKVVRPLYEEADECFKDGYASVKKDGKWGCIDAKGNVVVPIEYPVAPLILGDDAFGVSKKGRWGIRTKNGHFIALCDYDMVRSVAPRVYMLIQGQSFLLSDRVGNISTIPLWPFSGMSWPTAHYNQMLVALEEDVLVYVDLRRELAWVNKCAVVFLDDPVSLHPIEQVETQVSNRLFARANGLWGELDAPWCQSEKDDYIIKGGNSFSRRWFSILVPFKYSSLAALRRENG